MDLDNFAGEDHDGVVHEAEADEGDRARRHNDSELWPWVH
jgi:hypothetical protein